MVLKAEMSVVPFCSDVRYVNVAGAGSRHASK